MTAVEVREPRAALWGFYPAEKNALIRMLEQSFKDPRFGPGRLPKPASRLDNKIVGGVVPHAGYTYSGACAAHFYLELAERNETPDTVVIVGTNHTGYGGIFTTTSRYKLWATPLGTVEADIEFIEELKRETQRVVEDPLAHLNEHSIEVQLPFLQYIYGNKFKLVPVVAKEATERAARDFAEAVHSVAERLGRRIVFLASSDFTHHGPMYNYVVFTENVRENVTKLDLKVIEQILELDTAGFLKTIVETGATVCGIGAIAALIEYAKIIGAKPRLLKYYNSGDVTGDEDAVVGYAAIVFEKP